MTIESVSATVNMFSGNVILRKQNCLEVEYNSISDKISCEKFLKDLNFVILQGSFSDIGNKDMIHRVYFDE